MESLSGIARVPTERSQPSLSGISQGLVRVSFILNIVKPLVRFHVTKLLDDLTVLCVLLYRRLWEMNSVLFSRLRVCLLRAAILFSFILHAS